MRIIIMGGDKHVYYLAKSFIRRHYHVTIINRNASHCHHLAHNLKATVVLGDGSKPTVLEEAGARRADYFLALTPFDQDNLIACQIAGTIYGVPRTVALVNDPDNEDVFKKLGVTVAFSSSQIIASLIEQRSSFEDITTLMPVADGRVTVNDVVLHESSPVVGKTLQDLNLGEHGLLVACIIRGEDVIVPRGSSQLQAEDHLLVIGRTEMMTEKLHLLTGEAILD